MFRPMGMILVAAIIGVFCLGLGERMSTSGGLGFVSTAQAVVGRPLTPVSAGCGAKDRTALRSRRL